MRLIILRRDIDICFEIVILTVNLSWIILLTALFTTHLPEFPVTEFSTEYRDRDRVARAGAEYSGVTCE